MLEGSLAVVALVAAVVLVAVLAGAVAAGAVVLISGGCGVVGWALEGRRLSRGASK